MLATSTLVLFLLGFPFLIKGADLLVDGASGIAKKLGVSSLVVGLTIVAFGTSVPELVVSVLAVARDGADISVGNILGSNIANIFLVLGVTALIYPIALKSETIWKEVPLSLVGAAALFFVTNDILLGRSSVEYITRGDGLILLLFFAIFVYYMVGIAVNQRKSKILESQAPQAVKHGIALNILYIVVGIVGVYLGGEWLVNGAVEVAQWIGLSQVFIGLTIIAIGTSLPELVTSVTAALKKEPDVAVGNVVGSCIFNIFFVLGVSGVIAPIQFNPALNTDVLMVAFASITLFILAFIGRKHIIERWQGGALTGIYVCYIIYLLIRG